MKKTIILVLATVGIGLCEDIPKVPVVPPVVTDAERAEIRRMERDFYQYSAQLQAKLAAIKDEKEKAVKKFDAQYDEEQNKGSAELEKMRLPIQEKYKQKANACVGRGGQWDSDNYACQELPKPAATTAKVEGKK